MTCRAELHGPWARPGSLRPGESLSLGRHPSNDLVLEAGAVSRFQAVISWPEGGTAPQVKDLGSANGTTVDGRLLVSRTRPVRDGSLIEVEGILIRVRVTSDASSPAVRRDLDDRDEVALFLEVEGFDAQLGPHLPLTRVLLELERHQRTGTLTIEAPDGEATFTFGVGVIMAARGLGATGAQTLERALARAEGRARFTRDLVPCDQALSLLASAYLASRPTQRTRVAPRAKGGAA